MSAKSDFFAQVDAAFPDNIAEAIGADDLRAKFKSLSGELFDTFGNLDQLTTADKTGLVPAINELAKTAVAQMWVSATSAGEAVDGGDDTIFIRNSILGAGGRGVWFEPKIYRVNQNIQLPNNCNVSFAKGAKILVTANLPATTSGGNDTTYVFLAGDKCLIENVEIDGQGFNTGGILLLSKSNTTVRGCTVRNCIGAGFGIGVTAGQNNRVTDNTILDCVHGINAFRSVSLHILGNTTNRNFSGIYLVACVKSIIAYNIVENNDDVGIDCEHCINCSAYCNYSARAGNGEYAIFSGGSENADQGTQSGVIFKGNIAVRKATYVTHLDGSGNEVTAACAALKGACDFASLMAGAFNCGFEYNFLFVEFGYALSHSSLGDKSSRSAFFRHNAVITKSGGKFHRTLESDGLSITHNTFVDKGGGEALENELRDGHGLEWTDNTYTYEVAKTTLSAVLLNTGNTFATKAPYGARNHFRGCDGLALKVDMFGNFGLVPTLEENKLGSGYSSNGGLSVTTNGRVKLVDQRLKLLLTTGANNLAGLPAFARMSGIGKAVGDISYGRVGFNGLIGRLYFVIKGDGGVDAYPETINPAAPIWTMTGTETTGILTLTTNQGGTFMGNLDITVNSY